MWIEAGRSEGLPLSEGRAVEGVVGCDVFGTANSVRADGRGSMEKRSGSMVRKAERAAGLARGESVRGAERRVLVRL